MVNRCTVCNNLVAGHSETFGCKPGPGNCTVTPYIPPSSSSEGGTLTSSAASSNPTTNNFVTAVSTIASSVHMDTSQQAPTSSDSGSLPLAGPSTATSVNNSQSGTLSNTEMASVLASQNAILEARIKEAEATKTLETIYSLHARQDELKKRLLELEPKSACPQPPSIPSGVPPASSVTWSVTNPFAPPAPASGVSAASFASASAAFGGIPSSLASTSQSQSAYCAPHGFASTSHSFIPPTQFPPSLLGQSQCSNFTTSLPNLHNPTPFHQPPSQASGARGPLIPAQSVPNINMAASNENPFLSPEDIFNLNPVAKALLGLQNEAKEESVALGKYIPELFALKYGSINEIRSKMTYSEFIAMYTRMIMYMLRDDPHLVPDRLVFLYNLAKKAAKFRWPDVRECYGVAMHELKIKRRKWADPWDELTEDLERSQSTTRPAGNRPISARAAGVKLVSPLDPDRPLCADFNDRVCHRTVCKFNHECAKCGDKHPRRVCQAQSDTRPYPSSHSSGHPQST